MLETKNWKKLVVWLGIAILAGVLIWTYSRSLLSDGTGDLRVIQPTSVQQVQGMQAIDDLNGLIYLASRNQFLVTSFDESKIYVIDPNDWVVEREVSVGFPHRVVLGKDAANLFVSVGGGEVVRLETDTFIENGRVKVGKKPGAMAYDADRGHVWVANEFSDTVNVIDEQTLSVVDELRVGRRPVDIAIDRNQEYAYVTNSQDGSLSVISLSGRMVVSTVQSVGRPSRVLAHPEQDLILILDRYNNRVLVIDQAMDLAQVQNEIDVVEFPVDLALDASGDKLYVLSFSQNQVGTTNLTLGKTETMIDLESVVGPRTGLNNLLATAKGLLVTNTNTGKVYSVVLE